MRSFKNRLKNILSLTLLLAASSTAANAAVDKFGLGDGHTGALTVAGNQIVNAYAPVTAATATTMTIGTVRGTGTFAAGDLVLVLQTAGASGNVSGTQTTIDLSSSVTVAHWELQRVTSFGGGILTFADAFVTTFSTAAGATQVIRVPEYTTVDVPGATSITGSDWDGASGGVVAFLSNKGITNAGALNADGLGFMPGVAGPQEGSSNCAGMDGVGGGYGQKGDGIQGQTLRGMGNIANGGGGGNCHNSGGAGGGGAGRGGNGGGRWSDNVDTGGRGGAGLTLGIGQLTFGGGGGAGHVNESTGTNGSGARGGGAIFVRTLSVSGSGAIRANGIGAVTNPQQCDPGGGGGAGGIIHVRSSSSVACGSASVVGGKGGDHNGSCGAYTTSAMGVGGGGGGGTTIFQGATFACTSALTGGAFGTAAGNTNIRAQAGLNGSLTTVNGAYFVPSVTAPANASSTALLRPTLTIQGDPGVTMFVFVDGNQVCTGTADNTGLFSCTPGVDLSYGSHTVTSSEAGSGGDANDTGPLSPGVTFTVACNADNECSASNYCRAIDKQCTPKILNGNEVPSGDPGHNPTLNGVCTAQVGAATCVSAVCDTVDNKCGYLNGGISNCDNNNASVVCRSGVCSVSNKCVASGACLVDGDCAGNQFCSISTQTCIGKLANGSNMPTDVGHAAPVLNGVCNVDAAALVCASGVCDTTDNKCGFSNNQGTCNSQNAATVCRSGACDANDLKCGLANGGSCGQQAAVCRSNVCNSGACSACGTDADCGNATSGKVCTVSGVAGSACVNGCRGHEGTRG